MRCVCPKCKCGWDRGQERIMERGREGYNHEWKEEERKRKRKKI